MCACTGTAAGRMRMFVRKHFQPPSVAAHRQNTDFVFWASQACKSCLGRAHLLPSYTGNPQIFVSVYMCAEHSVCV